MAEIEIVPVRPIHLRRISRVMRQSDRDEIMAGNGMKPLPALVASVRRSAICMVALIDGKPEVIFGAGDLNILTGTGSVWLLGSDAILDHRRAFLRQSVDWRAKLFNRYQVMRNFVDCRNRSAIRWLRWMGARFSPPFRHRGHDFMAFELRAEDV